LVTRTPYTRHTPRHGILVQKGGKEGKRKFSRKIKFSDLLSP
jgi:hypothetical protein